MAAVNAELVGTSSDIRGDENYPQGCAFSPDGLCVLTATVGDSKLRLYNTITTETEEKWSTALVCQGGDAIRSYAWYPHMKSSDPSSCCFVATARDQPIHLFDAFLGSVRASYCPYNALDEMESPNVATFSPDGQRLWAAGFRTDRTIHVFDTARPGRDSTVLRLGKTRRSSDGQKGLVSALTSSSDSRIFAVGTYQPGSIYVYDDRACQQPTETIMNGICVVGHGRSHSRKKRRFAVMEEADSQENSETDWFSSAKIKWFLSRAQGGITQLRFAPNQQYTLYSASRRSDSILSWDLRMLSGSPDYQSIPIHGFGSFKTRNDTNQRIEFDLDETGSTIFVGGRDKCVRIYNVESSKLLGSIQNLDDASNGVSYSSILQTRFLAVATGARRFPTESDLESDEDLGLRDQQEPPGFLHLYRLTV